jgi:predicted nuclease of restriction endonuclease-like (RecB) superfamily
MRAFAAAWAEREIVQRSVAQLSWRHNITLLEKLKTQEERLWYATKAYEFGWSYNILAMQIDVKAHLRLGKAQNNFLTTLPPADSGIDGKYENHMFMALLLGDAKN